MKTAPKGAVGLDLGCGSIYDPVMKNLIDDLIDDGAGVAEWICGEAPLTTRSVLIAGMIYIVFLILFQLL